MKEKLAELVKLNAQKKGSKEKLFYFILDRLRLHIDEVRGLKLNNDPHVLKEIADMVLLSHMLGINEGMGDDDLAERLKKIEGKIQDGED